MLTHTELQPLIMISLRLWQLRQFLESMQPKKDGNFVVSSTKGVTGHTLGAAGGLEAIVAAKSIHENVVPPSINLDTPDPECDLDNVPNAKREMEVHGAMSTNLGFGGHNAAILFKKFTE
mmetsp:Transcript_37204/g.86782  ORF Transcript_37204/g.86782 Transcript_37204/m.86782 type:complete len:120 (+) Transcript_37204:1282-1641(+)